MDSNKRNKLRIIKTFEAYIGDSKKIDMLIVQYLQEILDGLKNTDIVVNDLFNKSPKESFSLGNGWFSEPFPMEIDTDERDIENQLEFEHKERDIQIIITYTSSMKVFADKSGDNFIPDSEDNEISHEVNSIILYTDDYDNEYNIQFNDMILNIVNQIIEI